MTSRNLPHIKLFYDVISPYAWIGFEALFRYQHHYPINADLKPFFLRDIMRATENRPPSFVPAKGAYILKDLERNGKFYGLDIRARQLTLSGTVIPKDSNWLPNVERTTEGAVKILLAVQECHSEKLIAVSRAFWTRLWTNSKPILSQDDFLEVLKEAAIEEPKKIISRSSEPRIFQRLKKNTQEALADGCFGAPWFMVHHGEKVKESFFGADRLHIMADLLGHKGFSYEQIRK